MNFEELTTLIDGGESLRLEFKSDQKKLSDSALMEAIVCLANNQGGQLLIGVEDNGVITGVNESRLPVNVNQLCAFIGNKTVPSLSLYGSVVETLAGQVVVLDVPSAIDVVSTSDGRMLMRKLASHGKPECYPMFASDITRWLSNRGQLDVTAKEVIGSSWEDLDSLEFIRLRRFLETSQGDYALLNLVDLDLARALGCVTKSGVPTLAGLLLLGKEASLKDHVPGHEVAFQVLRGQEIVLNETFRWPLLRTIDRVFDLFSARNEEQEILLGPQRKGLHLYDPQSFREAVNNALTHRDYRLTGAIHIQIYDDSLMIRNPGGFVEGIQLDKLLISGPIPRNPLLADMFKRLGLVERTGRGIGLIYTGSLRAGQLPPDYTQTTSRNVVVKIYGGKADLEFAKIIHIEEQRLNERFTLDELLILSYIYRERNTNPTDVGTFTQKSESDSRRVLEKLYETGLVERFGNAQKREYALSADVYRKMGRSSEYIRQRSFDNIQKEQMVTQFIKLNGKINRRDVIELCRVYPNQAGYILQKMVKKGIILKKGIGGHGRGTFYVLNDEDVVEQKRPLLSTSRNKTKDEDDRQIKLDV